MKRTLFVGGIIVLLALFYFMVDPATGVLPECPFYRLTGLFCPGCGSQRAMHALLHGRLGVSLGLNPLLFPGIVFIGVEIVMLVAQQNGSRIRLLTQRRSAPYIVLVVVLLFWILRNIPVRPFSWLAPHVG